jgi:putative flippase GtrA
MTSTSTPTPFALRLRRITSEFMRFGLVGGVGFVVDTAIFTLLRQTILSPEHVFAGSFIAKVISTVVAILVNWIGNRYWTFRHQRREKMLRESIEFFAVSLAGMVIALGVLGVSHYLMGYTSLLADTIANLVGLVIGAIFRFVLYRYWVFNDKRGSRVQAQAKVAEAA